MEPATKCSGCTKRAPENGLGRSSTGREFRTCERCREKKQRARERNPPQRDCEHGYQKHLCSLCGGSALCCHGRARNRCVPCEGKSVCHHKRLRFRCRLCREEQQQVDEMHANGLLTDKDIDKIFAELDAAPEPRCWSPEKRTAQKELTAARALVIGFKMLLDGPYTGRKHRCEWECVGCARRFTSSWKNVQTFTGGNKHCCQGPQ